MADLFILQNAAQKQLINCFVNGIPRRQKYPQHVREFCIKMHYLSPRAYELTRQTFNNNLPHERTIRKYYANSDLKSDPGITSKSLDFLKRKVSEQRQKNSELVCSVCLDEMSIRKQIIFDREHMRGYVTFGCDDKDDPLVAREAIVFIVSGVNQHFRIPVAYHFVNSLDSIKKAELVKSVLIELAKVGVLVTSITFDGHATNKKMCKLLGANLDIYSNEFQPYFELDNKHKIYIFYDACHAEKLIRGHMDKKGVLYDDNGDSIKWKYIEEYVNFCQKTGLSLTSKLNQSHLQWRRKPMNVRIAVETLSAHTADSIDFLRLKNYTVFAGSAPTTRFIRFWNNLFDVFNTKGITNDQNVFKNAMNSSNKNEILIFFDEATKYIKKLKFKEEDGTVKFICRSIAKAAFVGYVFNMASLKLMYEEYVEEKKLLSFIPTYYLNQDAVEIFFGKVRSRNGSNDNPNVVHFQSAYDKLLGCDSILTSREGNCEDLNPNSDPFSDILFVSSRRDKSHNKTEQEVEHVVLSEFEMLHSKLAELEESAQSNLTDSIYRYVIAHIASIIETKIKSTDKCELCVHVFDECAKINETLPSSKIMSKPCISTLKICQQTDRYIKLQLLKGTFNYNTIIYSIINDIDMAGLYVESDFTAHKEHKAYLIKVIIGAYVYFKATYLARSATQSLHDKLYRHRLRKLVHFFGQ